LLRADVPTKFFVMAELVPAIHVLLLRRQSQDVDHRHKPVMTACFASRRWSGHPRLSWRPPPCPTFPELCF
jgi:hypothetical protein